MADRSPLTESQWTYLHAEIIREARRTLIARRFLGLYGPLGAGMEAVRLETYGPDQNAPIEMVGRHDPDPIVATRETILRIPILFKDFIIHRRDVELATQLDAPLDASRAIRAAHFVADREDDLIFNGEERFGIEGLLNASNRNTLKRGDWREFGVAYNDVAKAVEVLLEDNHHRPFALVINARDYARLVRQREGQFAPEIDSIARLCDDGVYTTPVLPADKAVLISTGDQNLDIAVAEDLELSFLGERDQDYPFRVYECLVLRIKRPKAICTIE